MYFKLELLLIVNSNDLNKLLQSASKHDSYSVSLAVTTDAGKTDNILKSIYVSNVMTFAMMLEHIPLIHSNRSIVKIK